MRILLFFLTTLFVIGCTSQEQETPTPVTAPDPHAGHNHAPGEGHDHDHDHEHVTVAMNYDDLTGLAKLAIDSTDFETAIIRYMEAIKVDSSRVEGYYGIGYSFSELRNFTKAIEYFESALFINPDYRNTRLNLGNCQIMMEQYEEGISMISLAIEKDANCVPCYLSRANGYRQTEQSEKMCADLRSAERLGSPEAIKLLETDCK